MATGGVLLEAQTYPTSHSVLGIKAAILKLHTLETIQQDSTTTGVLRLELVKCPRVSLAFIEVGLMDPWSCTCLPACVSTEKGASFTVYIRRAPAG